MVPERISRYPVLRALGAGGMGEIYLARDLELDRQVALKVLRRDADAGAGDRLRGEARAAAALRHPNIVTVYEVGDDGERAFIAMEYIDGGSLRHHLERGLPVARILEVGASVARALSAAHAAGVLHRDIKPDNVMIDAAGVVKVVDFGIAHRLGGPALIEPGAKGPATLADDLAATVPVAQGAEALTTNTIFGTPAYISPEQLLGQPAEAASDVYALGVVLYEALAGHLPFRANNLVAALTKVADPNVPPEPLAEARPDLPRALIALIEAMLASDPGDRPGTEAVAARLDELAAPPTGRLPTRPPAPRRARILRRVWPIAIALAITITGLAVTALRGREAEVPAPPSPAASRRVAVAPIGGRFEGLGNSSLSEGVVADVLVHLIDSVDSLAAVGVPPGDLPGQLAAARAKGADLLLTAADEPAIDPRSGARLLLLAVPGGELRESIEIGPGDVSQLIGNIARAVATRLAPETRKDWSEGTLVVSLQLGQAAFARRRWHTAALYLEQAVEARPDLPMAWYYLAWARGWVGAPAAASREAARRAEETATTELERRLGRAIGLYVEQRYREAASILAPMVETNPRDRDLLYMRAEALFHDGQIAEALALFDRCLEVAPRFLPAAVHPQQVARARRDASGYRRYASVTGHDYRAVMAYLSGDDSGARALGFSPALLDLIDGTGDGAEMGRGDGAKALAFRVGQATRRGARREAQRDFAASWPAIARAAESPHGAFDLVELTRVLLIGDYRAELAIVRRWWNESEDAPVNLMARQELAVFGAPIFGTPLPPRKRLTTRMARAADALAASRAGHHREAADALKALADQPSGSASDYLVWNAYARELAAAGDTAELEARCRRWRRPGLYSHAALPLWAYCDAGVPSGR